MSTAMSGSGAAETTPATTSATTSEHLRWSRSEGDPYRYGVYLLPDPRTALAVTTATGAVRAQYGLVSAGAFPPHVTLVGSQHWGLDEARAVQVLDAALTGRSAVTAHNSGVRPLGAGWVYDWHLLPDGSPNPPLVALADAVDAAVAPLRRPASHPPSNDVRAESWHAHLSLASHDLYDRADLREEVGHFLRGLSLDVPATVVADRVALYRTASDDWSGRWWRSLTWEHVRTWRLRRD